VLAIVVLVAQVICFFQYIDGASLVFDSDKDWVYRYVCPRNSLDCRFTSDVGGFGWIFFAIFLVVHLLSDFVNGLKLIWNAPRYGLSWKTCQCLFGGICLCSISALALYSSVVYNIAISRSNLELIFNTVILLFVNELDEKMHSCLETISPTWLEMTSDSIKATFSNTNDLVENTGGEEVQDSILDHQRRINELEEEIERITQFGRRIDELEAEIERITQLGRRLVQRSVAMKISRGGNTKLKKKMAKIVAKQVANRKEIKRMNITNQEQGRKVESLESELKHFKAKFQSLS